MYIIKYGCYSFRILSTKNVGIDEGAPTYYNIL